MACWGLQSVRAMFLWKLTGQILLSLEIELHPLPLGGAREGDKGLRKGWAASRPHLQPLRSWGPPGFLQLFHQFQNFLQKAF